MKKCCENCAKKETCTRETGLIFGFCNIDFEPIQTQENEEKNAMAKSAYIEWLTNIKGWARDEAEKYANLFDFDN